MKSLEKLKKIKIEEPFGFMIKSEEAFKSNMNFFELLWKIAKP